MPAWDFRQPRQLRAEPGQLHHPIHILDPATGIRHQRVPAVAGGLDCGGAESGHHGEQTGVDGLFGALPERAAGAS